MLAKRIKQAAGSFPALVLSGPRQVGKTTLLRDLFPTYTYVSLDRPLIAEQAESDPEAFLRQFPAPIIVDEVQYAPRLFRYLKVAIDDNRAANGQYILTGSQKFTLMEGVTESLAGRVAVLDLEGLSCQELGAAGCLEWSESGITDLIIRGGLPELWTGRHEETRDLFLNSYIATYLERDVKQLLAVGNLRDFDRFLRACAHRSGQQLNRSDLARDVGVSVPTITQWLSILQALGHVVLLEPWFGNVGKRLVKSPKLYVADTGLLCALSGMRPESLWNSPMIGSLWESYVYGELRKQLSWKENPPTLWYYRDQGNTEVDFIAETGSDVTLYECKWTSSPAVSASASLDKVARILAAAGHRYRVVRKVVVSRASDVLTINDVDFCSPFRGLLAGMD